LSYMILSDWLLGGETRSFVSMPTDLRKQPETSTLVSIRLQKAHFPSCPGISVLISMNNVLT
jgi:hypothetical protein